MEDTKRMIQNFINDPSDETLRKMITEPRYKYSCLLGRLIDIKEPCIKECPGNTLHTMGNSYKCYVCRPYQLVDLWMKNHAEAILYAVELLACAESYVEQYRHK
jgi:hypothetical protein